MIPETPSVDGTHRPKQLWPNGDSSNSQLDLSGEHSMDSNKSEGRFLENQKYHALTASQRITLTHKYCDIPKKVELNTKEKDKNIIVDEEKEVLISSFPVSPLITSAFDNYVNNFEKASFKTLTANQNSEENKSKVPASNKFDVKSGFLVSPHIEAWEFRTHNKGIPQNVTFDGNITEIKVNSSDPLPSNIKLSEAEWSNIQKSASYSLRAISHCDWFQTSSTNALDEALSLLNPEIEQELKCIDILKDVKQMQIGLNYAFEKLAKLNVYTHSGVTSILRKDFLTSVGNTIPQEQKCQLFSAPFGTSFVFQNAVDGVSSKVKEFRNESVINKQLDTANKLLDQASKSGSGNPRNNYSHSPPRKQGGGKGKGKTKYTNQNYAHYHNTRQNPYLNAYNKFYNQHQNGKPFQGQGAGRGGGNGPPRSGPKSRGGPFKGQNRGKKHN